jgi:hypothetical protein
MGHSLMELVMQAAEETGFIRKDEKTGLVIGTGEEGVKGYLKWAALHKSDRFIALMARVAPKHVFSDVTHRTELTVTEIEAELRDRGLPVELLDHLLNAPEELDWDEDPDPYGLMKNVTPEKAPDDDTGAPT